MSLTPLDHLARTMPCLEQGDLDGFIAQPGHGLLLVPGDSVQRPESQDAAVVVRELAQRIPEGGRVAMWRTRDEAQVKARLGVDAFPALLFVKDGKVQSTITRIQDWAIYKRAADVLWGSASRSTSATTSPQGPVNP